LGIKKLSKDLAKELFKNYYNYKKEEEPLLEAILEAIGYNTLVIDILAKNLKKTKLFGNSLKKLLNELQHKGLLSIKQSTIATNYHELKSAKAEDIISAMYDLSAINQEELKILSNFSLFPEVAISFEDLEFLLEYNEDKLIELLEALLGKAWLDTDSQNNFKINSIIASIVREKRANNIKEDTSTLLLNLVDALYYNTNTGVLLNKQRANIILPIAQSVANTLKVKSRNLAILYERLGSYNQYHGSLAVALEYYKDYNKLTKELHNENPDNVGFKNGLAISYSKLGDIYNTKGDIDRALEYYEEDLKLTKELYSENPDNVGFKNGLAISYERLGEIYRKLGNYALSLEYLKKEIDLFKKLHKTYKDQIIFKSNLSDAYYEISKTYLSSKECSEAKKFIDLSFLILKELTENFPEYKEFKDNFQEVLEFIEKLNKECK